MITLYQGPHLTLFRHLIHSFLPSAWLRWSFLMPTGKLSLISCVFHCCWITDPWLIFFSSQPLVSSSVFLLLNSYGSWDNMGSVGWNTALGNGKDIEKQLSSWSEKFQKNHFFFSFKYIRNNLCERSASVLFSLTFLAPPLWSANGTGQKCLNKRLSTVNGRQKHPTVFNGKSTL